MAVRNANVILTDRWAVIAILKLDNVNVNQALLVEHVTNAHQDTSNSLKMAAKV